MLFGDAGTATLLEFDKNYTGLRVLARTDGERFNRYFCDFAKEYGIKNPVNLNPTQKIELAKRMKCDYFASNKQIKGILRLDIAIVEELFGH
jgi:hypothetical protein